MGTGLARAGAGTTGIGNRGLAARRDERLAHVAAFFAVESAVAGFTAPSWSDVVAHEKVVPFAPGSATFCTIVCN